MTDDERDAVLELVNAAREFTVSLTQPGHRAVMARKWRDAAVKAVANRAALEQCDRCGMYERDDIIKDIGNGQSYCYECCEG